jgi:hypothetical protein
MATGDKYSREVWIMPDSSGLDLFMLYAAFAQAAVAKSRTQVANF